MLCPCPPVDLPAATLPQTAPTASDSLRCRPSPRPRPEKIMASELNGKRVAILAAGAHRAALAARREHPGAQQRPRGGRHLRCRCAGAVGVGRGLRRVAAAGRDGQPGQAAGRSGCGQLRPGLRGSPASRSRRSATGRGRCSRPASCRGRTLTSFPSIRTDLRNAGAQVVDQEVAPDGNLITSRSPDDLPAFCTAIVELVAQADQSTVRAGVAP